MWACARPRRRGKLDSIPELLPSMLWIFLVFKTIFKIFLLETYITKDNFFMKCVPDVTHCLLVLQKQMNALKKTGKLNRISICNADSGRCFQLFTEINALILCSAWACALCLYLWTYFRFHMYISAFMRFVHVTCHGSNCLESL